MDPRFTQSECIVEATNFEVLSLWKEHCKDAEPVVFRDRPINIMDWQQDTSGQAITVGLINDEKPVVVSFCWYKINGCLVMFYEAVSRIVDHEMVEEWIKKNCNPKVKVNAMNFHSVRNHILEKDLV